MSSTQNLHSINPYVLRNRLYLKEFFKRPVVLACAIVYGISIVLSIVNMFISGAAMISAIVDMFNNIEATLEGGTPTSTNLSFNFTVSGGFIVSIVYMIAFILMYAKARNPKPDIAPTAGVTTFWVMSIIELVKCIFAAVILLFAVLVFALFAVLFANGTIPLDASADALMYEFASLSTSSSYYESTEFATTVVVIVFSAIAVMFAIMTAYVLFAGITQIRFASSMKKSLNTPNLVRKGAVGFAVYIILSAIFIVCSIFMYITYLIFFCFAPLDSLFLVPVDTSSIIFTIIISIVSLVVSLIGTILLAVFALGYNKHIKAAGKDGENLPMPVVMSAPASPAPQDTLGENDYASIAAPAAAANNYPESLVPTPFEEVSVEEAPGVSAEAEHDNAPTEEPEPTEIAEAAETEAVMGTTQPDNPYAPPVPMELQDINPEAREIVDSVLSSVSQIEEKQVEETPATIADTPASSKNNFCTTCGNPVKPDARFCSKCGNKLF